jgi:hypothetical protein
MADTMIPNVTIPPITPPTMTPIGVECLTTFSGVGMTELGEIGADLAADDAVKFGMSARVENEGV